jgi:IMP dehydrogenase
MGVPKFKEIRRSYGFDEVGIAPGTVTVNPGQADVTFNIGGFALTIPVLASGMDAVTSPESAITLGHLGGLGVMNLEGVQTRYDNPSEILDRITSSPKDQVTELLQKLYSAPIKEELVQRRVKQLKDGGVLCAVAVTPANTKKLAPAAVEAGADIIVIQSTVTTARHISKSYRGLVFSELTKLVNVPVIVGNCATYEAALELMETGIDSILVGVGPGAACTTREVVGVGVPQVTATMDCAAARDDYLNRTGRYVSIITDGGIRTGGDLCKAMVAGADGVMLGTPFAQCDEAPGKGFNWGMANSDPALPRGTRISVGTKSAMRQILFGPTSVTDGTQNLVGALKACMGMVGALTISEMHEAELVIAPSIRTEGKIYQLSG